MLKKVSVAKPLVKFSLGQLPKSAPAHPERVAIFSGNSMTNSVPSPGDRRRSNVWSWNVVGQLTLGRVIVYYFVSIFSIQRPHDVMREFSMAGRMLKAVILAGGKGTRLAEETELRPKPMVEIGGKPILWHIMKIYAAYGVTEFIICLGYKGYLIKEYFLNYYLHTDDVMVDLQSRAVEVHRSHGEPWKIHLIETGEDTMTGGRLKRVLPYLKGDDEFFMTYGDGVANIDIGALLEFHRREGKWATITAVHSLARFGSLTLDENGVTAFREKPQEEAAWINGGFFVLSPKVFDLISGDDCVWEQDPLSRLAADGQLAAYRHAGFWQPMDTLREKQMLQSLWQSSQGAPWKVWK